MKRFTMFLGLGTALILGTAVWASVPKLINFQGVLRDGSGNPVVDGSYSVTFRIYEVPTGGTLLWAETTSVTTADGLFAVLLGASNPVPDTVFKGSDRWLGIAVAPDGEMAVRQQLVSVGYAYRVNSVDSASGGTITSKVSIGPGHTNTGLNAFVAGENNTASGNYSTVGGGFDNAASGFAATVGGGYHDTASNFYATVGGGFGNTASVGGATVSGGQLNAVSGVSATVGGGFGDTVSGNYATVGGGRNNIASATRATIGGGFGNTASGFTATIAGGSSDTASGPYTSIGGGFGNNAYDSAAAVGGGSNNRARGRYSVVSGGGGANLADSNSALGNWSTVGGGYRNIASNAYASIDGGGNNTASGSYTTVGGGSTNTASAVSAMVGGGGFNTASGNYAAVGGGSVNIVSGAYGTIGGGFSNSASSPYATVGGGQSDTASGYGATVPGGIHNEASGYGSFAAGTRARALDSGSFVWSDGVSPFGLNFHSSQPNTFNVRCDGGAQFVTGGSELFGLVGVSLASGASAWTSISDSTAKRNIRMVDGNEILARVMQLPIKRWSYKAQDPSIEHIGPMAQDFYPLFQVGDDKKTISTIDPPGIALAAIQGLYKMLQEQKAENEELRGELKELRKLVQKLLAEEKESIVYPATLHR